MSYSEFDTKTLNDIAIELLVELARDQSLSGKERIEAACKIIELDHAINEWELSDDERMRIISDVGQLTYPTTRHLQENT